MINLGEFNSGFRSFAEGTSQLSRLMQLVRAAFQTAVTLTDIANAVVAGTLRLDRLQTDGGLALLTRNGVVFLREVDPSRSAGAVPTNGGYLFVKNGALMYSGTAGTLTTVAPS
jgi:hypothetical protein